MDDKRVEPVQKLEEVRARIAKAVLRFDDDTRRVKLIAVSKTHGPEEIEPLIMAGQVVFAENRVQEAQAKWPALKARHPKLVLHLIGPLQSNKVKDAVSLFDVIESVDREKIAVALAAEMTRVGKSLGLFVQVNIGMEPQKSGIAPNDAVAFVAMCREKLGLTISGLMAIPPAEEAAGPYFAQMAFLARQAGVSELSMGMSADFETAIAMGATQVRVGSALFGARLSH